MKKNYKQIIAVLFAVILIAVLIRFGPEYLQNQQGMKDYEEVQTIVDLPSTKTESTPNEMADPTELDNPYVQSLAAIDLSALQEENNDIIGWIFIPDTHISYPVVQGTDNDYYLNHTWKHNKSSIGSIFMECQNTPDFQEFNTIVYGHNLITNPAMFTGLRQYEDPEFWKDHPSVYILAQDGIYQYDIFSAYYTGVRTIVYGLSITKDSIKEQFIRYSTENSLIETNIIPEIDQKILTLSTCTDSNSTDTRWVVQAVLQEFTPLSEIGQ